jgi:ribosomal protein S12 methylthiotransferase accessory factor
MEMRISFPGGVAVNADVGNHVVRTDQSQRFGGNDAAPQPFDLFLASIGTCAGFYALRFCQKREIDTRELGVRLEAIQDPALKRVERIVITVELPPEFPEKYRDAIVRAIDQCAVKRHILEPPGFEVEVAIPALA